MKDLEVVLNYLKKKLEEIGIVVVDEAIYNPNISHSKMWTKRCIVAGYLPEKAMIVKVEFNFAKADGKNDYRFTICAQIQNLERYVREFGEIKIPRNAVGLESYDTTGIFEINHYINSNEPLKDDQDKIMDGTSFFRAFKNIYQEELKSRFSDKVSISFVPYYTEEYDQALKDTAIGSGKVYDFFCQRVIAKFPKDFFVLEAVK